jgi:hypothetical protein
MILELVAQAAANLRSGKRPSTFTDWIRTTGYTSNWTLPPLTNGAPSFFRLEAQP